MKILIADDDRDAVYALEGWLSGQGHTVVVAFDGGEALDRIQKERFDLLFLDHNMPEMTGLELVKYVKEHRLPTKTVVMTGYAAMQDSFARKIGTDEYISKPFRLEQVDQILRKYLKPASGFTVPEMLVVLFLLMVFTLGTSLALTPFFRAWNSQDDRLGLQRNIQAGMEKGLRQLRLASEFKEENNEEATIRFKVKEAGRDERYIVYLYHPDDPFGDPFNQQLVYELRKAKLTRNNFTYGDGDLWMTNVLPPPATNIGVNRDRTISFLDVTVKKGDDIFRLTEQVVRRNK